MTVTELAGCPVGHTLAALEQSGWVIVCRRFQLDLTQQLFNPTDVLNDFLQLVLGYGLLRLAKAA